MLSSEELSDAVAMLVGQVHELDNGPRAELRRATPRSPWSAALWRLLAKLPEHAWSWDEERRAQEERRWSVLLAAMAASSGLSDAAPQRMGATLKEASYSELRLNRLLRAEEDKLFDQVRAMAATLESKGFAPNWYQLARLLFVDASTDAGESIRRQIARDYYSAAHQEQTT
jgi:CRISPR system Cascade subunit CasB